MKMQKYKLKKNRNKKILQYKLYKITDIQKYKIQKYTIAYHRNTEIQTTEVQKYKIKDDRNTRETFTHNSKVHHILKSLPIIQKVTQN